MTALTRAANWAPASIALALDRRQRWCTLRARLAWAHDWVCDPALDAGFQTLPGSSFVVNGAVPAEKFRAHLGRRRNCISPTGSR